jgi:mitochondrial fission protein ELM1
MVCPNHSFNCLDGVFWPQNDIGENPDADVLAQQQWITNSNFSLFENIRSEDSRTRPNEDC